MKKSFMTLMVAMGILLSISVHAQIKNAQTETVKVYGNCGMCETKIEKAGNLKKIAAVDWNKDTQMATLTYDAKKTNQNEILKRIALAGYDSDQFLAPDQVYNDLPGCCQYDRVAKMPVNEVNSAMTSTKNHSNENHAVATELSSQKGNQLTPIFDQYFALTDALVGTDAATAATQSAALLASINDVQMDQLATDVHMIWMKVMADLKADAQFIANTKDVKNQRNHFMTLSTNMYRLMKAAKLDTPTFYQFCPMANNGKGANWLSKESDIRNPYYGAQMIGCGKTVETIK